MRKRYDLLIIGAGPGGYVAAKKAARLGMSVMIIDKGELGGTCVNRGCISTKALVHSSMLYSDMKECAKFGLSAENVSFDLQKIYDYRDQSAAAMRTDLEMEFDSLGIRFEKGTAVIHNGKNVRITKEDGTTEICYGQKILIATGASARVADIPGMDLPGVMVSDELLATKESQYKKMLILGGGVIGLEMATVFNGLGTEVTVIETRERLMPKMDKEFSEALEEILTERGIRVYKASNLESIREENGLTCVIATEDRKDEIAVDAVLVSVGRKPVVEGLFADDVDIRMNGEAIWVDDFYMTSMEDVYAVGDVIGGVQLAHVASAEASYVVERMNDLEPTNILDIVPSGLFVKMSIIPSCVYTDPEIASVGLSEEEARLYRVPVRVGRCIMKTNGQPIINKENTGVIKVVFAADSDVLLGAQMLCPRATDMIGELATAVANGLTSRQLMYAMRAHPTFNEAIASAVEDSRDNKVIW